MSVPSEVALTVTFEDDDSQEALVYSGESIVPPCKPSDAADQPSLAYPWSKVSGTPEKFHTITFPSFYEMGHEERSQTLTFMNMYSHKSIEELRFEDYQKRTQNANEPGPAERPSSPDYSPSSPAPTFPSSSSLASLAWTSPADMGSGMTPGSSTKTLPGSISRRVFKRRPRKVRQWAKTESKVLSVPVISSNIISTISSPSAGVSAERPSTSKCDFAFTPTVNFISESDPVVVFSPPQTSLVGKEPLSTLSVSEGQEITDALLESIAKCMQIQNSLHRLLLLKLQAHVTAAAGQTDADPSMEGRIESLNDAPGVYQTESATESLNDASDALSVESTDASLNDATKSPIESLDDIPASSSVSRVEVRPNDDREAPRRGNTEQRLDDNPASSSENSVGVERNDVPEASNMKSVGESLNDVPKTPGKEITEESLNDAPEAFNVESAVDGVNSTPGTSSVDDVEVNLNDAPGTESSRNGLNIAPGALLIELQQPLEALMNCVDIQRSLFQRLIAANLITAEKGTDSSSKTSSLSDNLDLHVGGQANMLEVQSKLEAIAFNTSMECNYARNPFTNQHLMPSTSEDVIRQMPVDKRPFSTGADGGVSSLRQLPHGRGNLETVRGETIYSGNWCEGKRHGKGEGLIVTDSTAHNGFYSGGWKHNMRHGYGKMMFYSGAVYDGQWQFDKMTGYGTLKHPDGTIQEGTWKEGSLHGCALFTWPHGVTEYREYDASRGQLSSCEVEKETAEKLSQMSSFRSKLLNLHACVNELKDEKHSLAEQLNALKIEHADMVSKLHTFTLEIRKNFEEQWERESQKQREEFGIALKAAEESQSKNTEEITKLKKELEETKGAVLCQICFERRPDCIIFPCSHLLYCRECVTKHKKKGNSRCPTCRGPINSEILCNVNHPS